MGRPISAVSSLAAPEVPLAIGKHFPVNLLKVGFKPWLLQLQPQFAAVRHSCDWCLVSRERETHTGNWHRLTFAGRLKVSTFL